MDRTEAIRKLGRNLEGVLKVRGGDILAAKALLASARNLDHRKPLHQVDKEVLAKFAAYLQGLSHSQDYAEQLAQIETESSTFLKHETTTGNDPDWQFSVYAFLRARAPDLGYLRIGEKLGSALNSLRKNMPQTRGYALEETGVSILKHYLTH